MSSYALRFLWLEKNIGVALDQKVGKMTIPVTEYFFGHVRTRGKN